MAERPEYPETKAARRKAWACGFLAIGFAAVFYAGGMAEAAPYAFAFFFGLAIAFGLMVEMDRLHRRVDALRDGNGLRDGD